LVNLAFPTIKLNYLMTYRMNEKLSLVIFLGPTAVGKTRLAIAVAKQLGLVEIISSDSRLFYRGMDIGTAKPNLAEMEGVPHHLIDIADPDEVLSLALYQKLAEEKIEEISQRGHLPFVVGGTGQYLRAIIEGWTPPEVAPNTRIRKGLQSLFDQLGKDEINRWLSVLDPSAYSQIDTNNPRRVLRALEVVLTTGKTFSSQRISRESPYHTLQIGLTIPRDQLFDRIDQRVEDMVRMGFIDEVKRLLALGYSADLPTLSAIGYQEMVRYIQGEISMDEAVVLIKRRTHAFVRRQANWFKVSDPDIHWFEASDAAVGEIVSLIKTEFWILDND
jgi:tRNA dimethylallyltransferase